MQRLAPLAVSLFVAWSLADSVLAEDGGGFWAGADIGVASLSRSYTITGSTQDAELALAFRGGYAWHRRLLLGLELGGWTLQAGDVWDPSEGEGIRTLYAFGQYYPSADSPLFLKAGFGHVEYWNQRPGEQGASGLGGMLGVGYDIAVSGSWYATPSLDYSWGEYDGATSPPGVTQDQRYRVWTVRFGFTYR